MIAKPDRWQQLKPVLRTVSISGKLILTDQEGEEGGRQFRGVRKERGAMRFRGRKRGGGGGSWRSGGVRTGGARRFRGVRQEKGGRWI